MNEDRIYELEKQEADYYGEIRRRTHALWLAGPEGPPLDLSGTEEEEEKDDDRAAKE